MTNKLTEKPLDRMNYYNGQRLEASDLRLEQEYHIRVRRWLNKSLYSAGIARGLEVRPETLTIAEQSAGKKPGPRVVVSPGLALDAEGHEIILLDEERLVVMSDGRRSSSVGSDASVEGVYLTIRYSEEVAAVEKDGCEVSSVGAGCGNRPAWGGPTRVRAKPLFAWRSFLPPESSGEVALALVELALGCAMVSQVDSSARRYVGGASVAKVRQYALEGEREVACIPKSLFDTQDRPDEDVFCSARVYFHIRGRQPSSVTLILRGTELSPLHYSELARHKHGATIEGAISDHTITLGDSSHTHGPGTLASGDEIGGVHTHSAFVRLSKTAVDEGSKKKGFIWGFTDSPFYVLDSDDRDAAGPQFNFSGGLHKHKVEIGSTTPNGFDKTFAHQFDASGSRISSTGNDAGFSARSGEVMKFLRDLRITIDDKPQTSNILSQLAASNQLDWGVSESIGSGARDVFVDKGTGPIRLDFLPDVVFSEGEHCIEFSVLPGPGGEANGGRVLYNLYIE